jgi:hypothetical protein
MFASFFVCSSEKPLENLETQDPFRLPIQYVDNHELTSSVALDLELAVLVSGDDADKKPKTMYHHLINPKTPFEENLIPCWTKYYTTNTEFLKDTQTVIKSVDSIPISSPDYENIMTIWKDTKEDAYFLERYSYMELEMFRWVNHMPSFLQAITVVNMTSPILSFLVPFIFFLLPFFIVKMQGNSITLSHYLAVLKELSRHHFIGKMINTAEQFNFQNLVYLFGLAGLYIYQIYQNYMTCSRFYENITKINKQICEMQQYLAYTTNTMASFGEVIKDLPTYKEYRADLADYYNILFDMQENIQEVRPFTPSFSKIGEIGKLLGCYYEFYSNDEYAKAIKYSISFHGYIQSLKGINENLSENRINFASFVPENVDLSGNSAGLVIKEQYYPALVDNSFVTNDVDLTKNKVITGPNAAGKTTYLKTTMLNIIFTQQFGCGFYSECSLKPYTHLHSYLNIPDTSGRDSLFQAESRRCKEIIDKVMDSNENERQFCIFDELYSGTNPTEATKSAYAFLIWLSERDNVDFILTTHYVDICKKFKKSGVRIDNWQMEALESVEGNIEYTYKLVKGVSKIQGAVKVLREMNYPEAILNSISEYDKKS